MFVTTFIASGVGPPEQSSHWPVLVVALAIASVVLAVRGFRSRLAKRNAERA